MDVGRPLSDLFLCRGVGVPVVALSCSHLYGNEDLQHSHHKT